MIGTVKWFDNAKGYGFIKIDSIEAFVHYSQILSDGFKTLSEGEKVAVGSIIKTDKGYQVQAVIKSNSL